MREARKPEGYEQLSVSTSEKSLSAPTSAIFAVVTVLTAAIRYRNDGVAPTASIGMPVAAGDTIYLYSPEQINQFQVIAQSGTAEVNVSYYSAHPSYK